MYLDMPYLYIYMCVCDVILLQFIRENPGNASWNASWTLCHSPCSCEVWWNMKKEMSS